MDLVNGAGSADATARGAFGRRNIEGRVPGEESGGMEREAGGHDGLIPLLSRTVSRMVKAVPCGLLGRERPRRGIDFDDLVAFAVSRHVEAHVGDAQATHKAAPRSCNKHGRRGATDLVRR